MENHNDDSIDDLNSTLTDETQCFDTSYEKCDNFGLQSEQLRFSELKRRFQLAIGKIEGYERKIADVIEANVDESPKILSDKFKINDECTQDIIFNVNEYIKKLEDQFGELDEADNQVGTVLEKIKIDRVAKRVTQEIDVTCDQLISDITREIDRKREILKLETNVFKNESLVPLKACRVEIHSLIMKTRKSISTTEFMNYENFQSSSTENDQLLTANRNIGGIPAVPLINELPYLNFKKPSKIQINELLKKIHEMGIIVRLGPIQIHQIEEKPASVFVKWGISDPEYLAEEHTYVLQKAHGEILDPTSDEFETIYEGSEESCFVKNLLVDQIITLRVGVQSLESAWSAPCIAKTSITNYRWSSDNKDYMITNNGTVATKINDQVSTLFSQDALLDANQIIEFKFLEVPIQRTNDEGIALLFEPRGKTDTLKRNGALMITAHGKIFMDGEEKLMQLPSVYSGSRIIFTVARRDEETLKINIESSDKAVTYYWNIATPLFFAAKFLKCNKWNLIVK